jgi:hypothetical protein
MNIFTLAWYYKLTELSGDDGAYFGYLKLGNAVRFILIGNKVN